MGSVPEIRGHDWAAFPEALRGKRILLCTESFGPVNGVSRTTMMLVEHLRTHGVHVAVVAPKNHTGINTFIPKSWRSKSSGATGAATTAASLTATAQDTAKAHHAEMEVRVQGYPLPYNHELTIVYPVRLSQLYRRTFGVPPDLIYLASPASLGFQVMLQLRQQPQENQIPIICNFQTDLAGYCSILFSPPFNKFAVFAFENVESFLFRHPSVKTIFYPSRFVRRYLDRMKVRGEKLEVLQRGVKTDLFHPSKRSQELRQKIAPNGEIILICVARVAGEKGFDFLAKVAKELDARSLPFKLLIVGGNPAQEVVEEIKAGYEPLLTQGRVIFAGQKTGEDLAAHFASGDIFCHCSITETFGLVVLESMASGVPVVARDEGGPSDIVQDGKTGFLVPPMDLDAFVEKVILLANDPVVRQRFSLDARRQAEEATWEKINNKVAWRMVDTIEAREHDQASRQLVGEDRKAGQMTLRAAMPASTTPVFSWLFMNADMRARIVDARIGGGLAVIFALWGVVGLYLLFIKAALWLKTRVRG